MKDYESSYNNLQDVSTLNDLEKERLTITSKCLGIWKYLISSKEFFEIFSDNISNMPSTCVFHEGCVYNEYCLSCKQDLCSKCISESKHKSHHTIMYSDIVNESQISEKITILNDLVRMNLDNNTTLYKNTDSLLCKKIQSLQLRPQLEEIRNDIAVLEKKRRELAKSYSVACTRDDCWVLLFKLNLALYENSRYDSKLNYVYVKNVESTWHFYIDNESKPPHQVSEHDDIQVILQYYEMIISSLTAKPFLLNQEQRDMRKSFSKLANHVFVNITAIELKCEQFFDSKRNKIKMLTLLQNGTFAVCSERNAVKLYSFQDLSVQMKYYGHKSEVNYICCFGNDYFFLCCSDGKIIRYRTNRSRVFLHLSSLLADMLQFDAHKGSVIKILNDNDQFLYSLGAEDRCLKKWRYSAQSRQFDCANVFTFDSASNNVHNFVTMEKLDDGRIVTSSDDNVLRYWNNDGEIISNRLYNIDCVCVSGIAVLNRKSLLIGGKTHLFLINTGINSVINKFNYPGITSFVCLSTNSFLCVDNKAIYEFGVDINNLELVIQQQHNHQGNYAAIGMIDYNSVVTVGEDSRIAKWEFSIAHDDSNL